MLKLHEPSARRPDFLGGIRLTLGDGQVWSVPRLRIEPVFVPGPAVRYLVEGVVDARTGPVVMRYLATRPAPRDPLEAQARAFGVAWILACRNYTLAPRHGSVLFGRGFARRGAAGELVEFLERFDDEILFPLLRDMGRTLDATPQ